VAPSLAAKEDEVIEKKPNIIVIMTDEHNLKTLGCYRDLLGDEQAYPWGPGVNIETPYIDSFACEGGREPYFPTFTLWHQFVHQSGASQGLIPILMAHTKMTSQCTEHAYRSLKY